MWKKIGAINQWIVKGLESICRPNALRHPRAAMAEWLYVPE